MNREPGGADEIALVQTTPSFPGQRGQTEIAQLLRPWGEPERTTNACRRFMKRKDIVNEPYTSKPSDPLAGLAERIESSTGGDFTLPPGDSRLLRQIVRHIRQGNAVPGPGVRSPNLQRPGVIALFAGKGNGKVIVAAMLANELDLPLYRIDLSEVVSKYTGETEKNLNRLFDAAEQIEVVLFLDEADALFGRRSEIKDSHDRYADIEVEYLLQRLESHRGLAVLSTSIESVISSAFARHIHYVIRFPPPTVPDIVKRAGNRAPSVKGTPRK
jgi:hypothetical protein